MTKPILPRLPNCGNETLVHRNRLTVRVKRTSCSNLGDQFIVSTEYYCAVLRIAFPGEQYRISPERGDFDLSAYRTRHAIAVLAVAADLSDELNKELRNAC